MSAPWPRRPAGVLPLGNRGPLPGPRLEAGRRVGAQLAAVRPLLAVKAEAMAGREGPEGRPAGSRALGAPSKEGRAAGPGERTPSPVAGGSASPR